MKSIILKVILGIIFLIAIQGYLYAQYEEFRNSTPEEKGKVLTEWMHDELKLDSSVVKSAYEINLKYAKLNQVVMSSDKGKLKKLKEMKANSESKDKELKKIFTKEQYDKYQKRKDELLELMKEKIKEKRKNK